MISKLLRSFVGFFAIAIAASCSAQQASRIHVRNAGIPGQNSREGLERFQRDVIDVHPQVVLLYFGMNDSINEPKMLGVDAYLKNMGRMIDMARAVHIVPIIST